MNRTALFQATLFPRKKSKDKLTDRFIPNRSAMDFDYAHYMLTDGRKEKENSDVISPSKEAYQKQLREVFNMNRTSILAFKSKPPAPVEFMPKDFAKPIKPLRKISRAPDRVLDLPGLILEDPFEPAYDYCLNLMDWGCTNVLALALADTVYFWDAEKSSASKLVTVDDSEAPISSVNWASDGRVIAVGLDNSHVQLWDSTSCRKLRTLRGGHQGRVGSLAWNDHILTTGSEDGKIISHDVRIRDHIVQTYRAHKDEICGLKWSASGQQLASGGYDNLLHIWDRSMASSQSASQWLHRLQDHTAAVKALAWCPFQGNLLASGGCGSDGCIKFWNTHTGACLNSVDTESHVGSLLWSKNERELLSSHGYPENQLTLWKYPSMVKMAELTGHKSRVSFMAQSPNGCTVASAGGDERLRFWNVFGYPQAAAKPASKTAPQPFPSVNRIR